IAGLGGRAALLSGISTDTLGTRLYDQLIARGVDTRFLLRSDRPTALLLVGLDPSGHPDFTFYGENTADCTLTTVQMPDLTEEIEALHLASYPLVVEPVASALAELLGRADGRFVSLDPNVRPTIAPDMSAWRRGIEELYPRADLIKVSTEDLGHLHPGETPRDIARNWARSGPGLVVLTDGPGPLTAYIGETEITVQPPEVSVADTVGAGDALMAALLTQMQRRSAFQHGLRAIPTDDLKRMLEVAAVIVAQTCATSGARLPERARDLLAPSGL
ncbi:MAG: carbohydrate kinase, partial [Pseudomonadota bacterium]